MLKKLSSVIDNVRICLQASSSNISLSGVSQLPGGGAGNSRRSRRARHKQANIVQAIALEECLEIPTYLRRGLTIHANALSEKDGVC
ncbi:MAG: hypothetical protein A2521_17215 [Deltaproteobacteria bacterium RIFOXYD12_FULL_57_12]|nr:MAG: hypothetical protein A2521_17215 [Deltaproteobacteria bacterium RIFOXYD12_FULL_57_12]